MKTIPQPICLLLILWCFGFLALVQPAYPVADPLPSRAVLERFADVPVDVATGDVKRYEKPDLFIKSVGLNVELARNYSAQRAATGPFGYGWQWTHGDRLVFKPNNVVDIVTENSTLTAWRDYRMIERWAQRVNAPNRWNNSSSATNRPDIDGTAAKLAWTEQWHLSDAGNLEVGGWGFSTPGDFGRIIGVEVTGVGRLEHPWTHPLGAKMLMQMTTGGASEKFSQSVYDSMKIDLTGNRSSWNWTDVNDVQIRFSKSSEVKGGRWYPKVYIDAVKMEVTYESTDRTFKTPIGAAFTLEEVGTEYHLTYKDRSQVIFDSTGKLVKKIDTNGNELLFDYDNLGRLARMRELCGQSLSFVYENQTAGAKVIRVEDHLGRVCSYGYTGDDLTTFTDLEGNPTRYEYLSGQVVGVLNHNLSRVIDPAGVAEGFSYYTGSDGFGTPHVDKVAIFTDALGQQIRYVYSDETTYIWLVGGQSFQGVEFNSERDISRIYIRDHQLLLDESDGIGFVCIRHPGSVEAIAGGSWSNLEWAANGVEDGREAVTTDLRPEQGVLATGWNFEVPTLENEITRVTIGVKGRTSAEVVFSAGGTAARTWTTNASGWIKLDITGDLPAGQWTWDAVNNLAVQVARSENASTNGSRLSIDAFRVDVTYQHFDPGHRPEDRIFYYDPYHNLVASEQNGAVTSFRFDEKSNMISQRDPMGAVWTYEYEPVGNKLAREVDPLGRETRYEYDTRGNLIRQINAEEKATVYERDAHGNVVRETDALGRVREFEYDVNGVNQIGMRDARGHWTRYDYDLVGNPIRVTDPAGGRRHFRYNRYNEKVWEEDEAGVATEYRFDKMGRLTNMVVAAGTPNEVETFYTYDAADRVLTEVDALGYGVSNRYDAYGNRIAQTDKEGQTTVYRYDVYDRLIEDVDSSGATNRMTYDGRGNILTRTDARGFTTRFEYDPSNRETVQVDPVGNRVESAYDRVGNLIEKTVRTVSWSGATPDQSIPPVVTRHRYDALNRPMETIEGAGRGDARVVTMTYDELGRVIRAVDPLGHYGVTEYNENGQVVREQRIDAQDRVLRETRYVFDDRGLPVEESSILENGTAVTRRFEYDARGLKTAEIDPRGGRTTFVYDMHRRLVAETDPLGSTRTYVYDKNGNKVRETDPRGTVTTYSRDRLGRVVEKTSGMGLAEPRTHRYAYDAQGRLIRETDPLGHSMTFAYDAAGNRLQECDKRTNCTAFVYDALGRVTEVIDALTNRVQKFYDGRGGVWKEIDPLGNETLAEFDLYGRQTRRVDGEGNATIYAYDAADQRVREENPRGLITAWAYDGAGMMTNRVTGVGLSNAMTTVYLYDRRGRLIRETDPAGESAETTYDANGNVVLIRGKRDQEIRMSYDAMNRLVEAIDPLGHTNRFEYDEMDHILEQTDKRGSVTRHAYNAFGEERALTDPEGQTTTFGYDRMGRRTTSRDPMGYREEVVYDPNGNGVWKRDKRGSESRFVYDALNRVVQTTDALGQMTRKQYDGMGWVVVEWDKRGEDTLYVYDANGRILRVTDPATNTVTYGYDEAGNRVREVDGVGTVALSHYDRLNRLMETVVGAGLPEARVDRYGYDIMGRMVVETDPLNQSLHYIYDADGNRTVMIDKNGGRTEIVYDRLGREFQTIDPLGHMISKRYDPEGNLLEETDRRGNTTYSQYDALGRVTQVRDPEGAVTRFLYDAVGNVVREIDPAGTVTFNEYDGMGLILRRVIGEGLPDARVQTFEYDLLGRQVRAVDPLGDAMATRYDANGNVTNQETWSRSGSLLRETYAVFDSRNLMTASIDAEGATNRFIHDALGRVVEAVHPLGGRIRTVYDAFGNLVKVTDEEGHVTQTVYDLRNQPIRVIDPLGFSVQMKYDANGNKVAQLDDDGNAVYTEYDALNRVEAVNTSMAEGMPPSHRQADVNGDGRIDQADVEALREQVDE